VLNYHKNKLINQALDEYYDTFSHTLDTADFVPEKYNNKINRYIFKNMKRAFKKLNREDRIYQRKAKKKAKINKKQEKKRKKQQFSANKQKKFKNEGGKKRGIFQSRTQKNG